MMNAGNRRTSVGTGLKMVKANERQNTIRRRNFDTLLSIELR